ncbi:MAG: MBL fold metallo-hydrolase, partial [Puniceicoccales bacterium]|nr:MBL fold metallo-hydrolase [Puniceicoccales bacterium]
HPECMRAYAPPDIPLVPIVPDGWVEDGQSFTLGTMGFTILHLPGHTAGQMGLYFPKNNQVFVGDTLFRGDVGRTDLPTGNSADLLHSIRTKLYSLPNETVVYPGHGPPTTVGEERKNNSFTRR